MKKKDLPLRLSLLRRDGYLFLLKKTGQGALAIAILLSCTAVLLFFGTTAPSGAYKLPDTGQTNCYNSSGTVVGCSTSGQDGQYSINPMLFMDNNNGTIEDANTGLSWQKCSVGQTNDDSCSGSASLSNWYQASGTYDSTNNPSSQSVCGTLNSEIFAGFEDWRLPSAKELQTIVDYSIASPSPIMEPGS